MNYHKPRCAGVCYPRKEDEVLTYFRNFYDQTDGPAWPTSVSSDPFLGIIAPHIDYRVTTRAYAWAYEKLLCAPTADVYLILGVGHKAKQEWSCDPRGYLTPLGTVETASEILDDLQKESPSLFTDPQAHAGEHSIEFPLIALQAFRKLLGIETPFRFVPILCGGLHEALYLGQMPGKNHSLFQLGALLRKWHQTLGSKIHLIVSIDGCHIGPRFQHPYAVNAQRLQAAEQWEEILWKSVETKKTETFYNHLFTDANARHFDGVGALALMMELLNDDYTLTRTCYEQWFEAEDFSVVTFTSGTLTR